MWCWRRLLRVPWTARRSNQSILKEISPGCSLERMMLKLKLQYFGHLMQRVDSLEILWCWEGLGAGGKGDDQGWYGWMASPTRWTWVWVNSGSWWWTGRPGVLRFMGSQRVGHDWSTKLNWTDVEDNVICKQWEFYFFVSNLDSFYFFFSLWLLWLKLLKLCWIVVVRVDTLVFFLTLGEMLSIFHHWG